MKAIMKIIVYVLVTSLCFSYAFVHAEGGEWICPGCGAENTTKFCIRCGSQKPEDITCPNCGTKYPLDSGAVFCGDCGTRLEQGKAFIPIHYEGAGFSTPEEAVTCYMEGYKNLDFDQILGAFAWETQASHASMQMYAERIRSYSPAAMPRMPSFSKFVERVNVDALRSSQVRYIYAALDNYILGEDAPQGMMISLNKPEDVEAFMQKFDNGKLEKLALMANIRFVSPDLFTNNLYSMETNQDNLKKQTAYYNADEVVNIVGLADVGDETFFCCPTVARYGDRWYLVSISSMASNIMGLSSDYQAFTCGKAENMFLHQ